MVAGWEHHLSSFSGREKPKKSERRTYEGDGVHNHEAAESDSEECRHDPDQLDGVRHS